MKTQIANPIFDIVFKYMMEDEESARIILSVLLKKKVVKASIRRHEYTNPSKDNLSMFRIDFGATIIDEKGDEQLILIELQKAWLESEILRFRKYIATHYMDDENMKQRGSRNVHALPMVSVFLLGHSIGEIQEPALYINHKAYDYEGKEVTEGVPNRFIEGLTHDVIIVQIPQLSEDTEPANRLEEVFCIFNQRFKLRGNSHILAVDEDLYEGDEELAHLVHRLETAAMDVELRRKINVEDEFFTELNNRDKKLERLDKLLSEKNSELCQKIEQLNQKNEQLSRLIKLLKARGLSAKEISISTGLSIKDVEEISKGK